MPPLATLLIAAAAAASPAPVFTGRIEVAASRLGDGAAPVRASIVLTREEIARLPVASVQELLLYLAGAGLARRGAFGVQGDAQLRGATFEQIVVLVDGVRMNDPQTGHFHLDVPLPLAAVEQVEVVLGPGSAVHGPDAFGGVVAITTGPPRGASARLGLGQHGRRLAEASAPLGAFALAVQHDRSDGFRPDTEYKVTRGSVGWSGAPAGWKLRLAAAAEEKAFGAWAFYSLRFPDERERTSAAVFTLAAIRPLGAATLTLRAGGRQHDDDFILDRRRPEWYRNRHRTRSGVLQAAVSGAAGSLAWACGIEGERATIVSSRLGAHDRGRGAAFAEGAWAAGRVRASVQARADHAGGVGWEVSPGAGAEIDLGGGIVLALHRARSFRLPSFTDLYYTSPGTIGNPALRAEQASSDELLLRAAGGRALLELSIFRRHGRDLIDFVADDSGVYRATNTARAVTSGVQAVAVLGAIGRLESLRLGAAWLDSEIAVDPARSRYALAHPRWELTAAGSVALPLALRADLAARYRMPQVGPSYAVLDLRLRRLLGAPLALEIEAANLLDRRYEELSGVPMPGRSVAVSVVWSAAVDGGSRTSGSAGGSE